jgi:predicted phosphodiesterase
MGLVQKRDVNGRFTCDTYDETNVEEALTEDREQIYKDEITNLRKLLKQSYREQNLDEELRKYAFELGHTKLKPPQWLTPQKPNDLSGIPHLFLSDWHWGETVIGKEISGINSYNLTIAKQRCTKVFDEFIDIYTNKISPFRYDGCVVALGGDMVSGTIHDELNETNDVDIMPQVVSMTEYLISGIDKLLDEFHRVAVFCVVGNHGRTTKEKRFKRKTYQSFDWLCYQMLDKYFSNNNDIHFVIPQGSDVLYKIYNTTFLLSHGDQLGRGGDSIIGMLGPVTRGDHKRRTRQMGLGEPYDVLICGHYHQLAMLRTRIVNGSLKGFDEYAYGLGLPPEPPAQASWLTHPTKGVTIQVPVFCSEEEDAEDNYSQWVSWQREDIEYGGSGNKATSCSTE